MKLCAFLSFSRPRNQLRIEGFWTVMIRTPYPCFPLGCKAVAPCRLAGVRTDGYQQMVERLLDWQIIRVVLRSGKFWQEAICCHRDPGVLAECLSLVGPQFENPVVHDGHTPSAARPSRHFFPPSLFSDPLSPSPPLG